jgi:DHA2 family multidrug resistance protein
MADRNFGTCCVIIFCAYAVLYANAISLPALLQSLFGYDATTSGLVLSPSGIFAIIMLVVVGALLSRGVDARYLMAGGLITMAIGNFWMAHLNLEISPWQVVWPRVVVIAGLSMLFAPLNVAAFSISRRKSAALPSDCWLCCATRVTAWELRSLKLFRNDASSFILCG